MSAVTLEEKILLVEFKEKVKDVLQTKEQHEDSYLVRWLRARDFDMRKAENMLRTSLKWRTENNVDKVLEIELDPFMKTEFPYFLEGVDKNNNPVVFMQVGKYDFRKPVAAGKMDEFKTYFTHFFEFMTLIIKEQNKNRDPKLPPVTQFTSVLDWAGFPYMQLLNIRAIQAMLQAASIYEAHYPEVLCRSFFINCPSFFNIVLELFKSILAPRTLNKIEIFGWNQNQWETALKAAIDDEHVSNMIKRVAQT